MKTRDDGSLFAICRNNDRDPRLSDRSISEVEPIESDIDLYELQEAAELGAEGLERFA